MITSPPGLAAASTIAGIVLFLASGLLFTGLDALPFLKEGEIADRESFAAANDVFGGAIWNYAVWFN